MASVTQTYACIGSAMIDKQNQSTNYSSASSYEIVDAGNRRQDLLLKFTRFPDNLRRKKLYGAYIREYFTVSYPTNSLNMSLSIEACKDFDESAVNFGNAPTKTAYCGSTRIKKDAATGVVTSSPTNFPDGSSSGSADFQASKILEYSCVRISLSQNVYATSKIWLNTRRAGSKPTLIFQYDDTETVRYVLRSYSFANNFINRFIDNKFTWTVAKDDSAYCVAVPVQTSAVFHWRAGSSGDFNEIPIPGNTMEITIPANTFPGTDNLQWYVTGIDDFGIELPQDSIHTASTLAGDLTATPASPIDGAFIDPLGGSLFMWTLSNSHSITVQTGADLQYSSNGTSWTDLGSVEGDSQSFTSPANTFGTGTYYWLVRAYNADGEAGPWSSAATFSTVDSPMSAIPEHPVSEICEINRPITFSWGYSSDTGTVPERSDLQYSRDANEWTDLATVTGRVFTYTVPADFFLAGTVYWRARAYNHNNVVGSWSDAVSFIVFGAPNPPSVSVDAVPFAVIRWQVSGQEAYKVTVDGVEYGAYFGSAKSFEVPEPLEPGRHSASVVVQGQYGLWSPAGEIVFDITNVPGASVDLTGSFGRDAALSWSCADETADFLIYRDDVLIGHTRGNSFTDRAALGYHSYSVFNRLPGGYYTASNVVSGTMSVDCLALAPLRGGAWVDLALSENSDDAVTYTETQQVSLRQFAGRDYPTAERSRYKTRVARFNAAWEHESADALAFEAMLGELVIYKHRDGRCFVGVLSAFELASKKFYKAYAASVQQSTWKEYTDADS